MNQPIDLDWPRKTKQRTVYMTNGAWMDVRRRALETGKSASQIVEQAVAAFLEGSKPK